MRIGIFSQWYEPEPGPAALPAVLGRALADRGHEVHVLTGFPNYPSGKLAPGYRQALRKREVLGGVSVTRVPLYLSHDSSALRRVANYSSFAVSAALLGVPPFPPIDALWVNYSPITIGVPMWLQQLIHGTPTVCEVGDLWPDTLSVAGLRGSGSLAEHANGLLSGWCKAMYATSDAVAYISPSVGEILASRGVPRDRLHYIPKPANEAVFHVGGRSLRQELAIDENALVLVYAGTMGAAQGLDSLIEACGLVDDPRLVVIMAGSGTHETELRSSAGKLPAGRIRFLGRVPQARVADLLATCDAAFISLADHPSSAMTMPSKTQSTLASGTAILAAANGDLAALVENSRVGITAAPGNSRSIAAALTTLVSMGRPSLAKMGTRARRLYETEFSVSHIASQAEELLGAIAGAPQRGVRRFTPGKVASA
ncbi:MAG: glycosyltransferase family 4 protein [Chthonomonadales bacterium]|nr:glycosyltransferase family 4 protein [Chthonomonadales bacterium]